MAGRHPKGMTPRDESAHPLIKDAIAKGYVGTGRYYEVDGFRDREAADRGRRSINNGCRHLGVSCSSKEAEDLLELTDGTWRVRFRLWPKNAGRAHVRAQTGGDPAQLAYNPFQRAEGPVIDESGAPLRQL
jgi:hypothetical protein